jgi:hypothetical protein
MNTADCPICGTTCKIITTSDGAHLLEDHACLDPDLANTDALFSMPTHGVELRIDDDGSVYQRHWTERRFVGRVAYTDE